MVGLYTYVQYAECWFLGWWWVGCVYLKESVASQHKQPVEELANVIVNRRAACPTIFQASSPRPSKKWLPLMLQKFSSVCLQSSWIKMLHIEHIRPRKLYNWNYVGPFSLRKTLTDWAELELHLQKRLVETWQTFVLDNERRAAKYSMTFAFRSIGYFFYMVSMSGLYPQWPYMVGLLVMRVSGREYLTQHLHTHVHIL
jgi:hypothetical protein